MTYSSLFRFAIFAAVSTALTTNSLPAQAKLQAVASTPDLAALLTAIGGDRVSVKSLAKPTEDPHFVDAKPSHIVTLNRADVLIEGGAELEIGWLPALLESARNDKLASGAPGHIVALQGIRLSEIPTSFDRAKGDVHSLGNPHFLMDPANVKVVVAHIAERLSMIDPPSAAVYAANLKRFDAMLDAKTVEWDSRMAPYAGAKIVTYHKDFVYFADRFKLQIVETLEPKPGIAPSPAHLARVIETIRSNAVRVIIVQPFHNRRTAENVARQAGASVVDAAQQPGAIKNTDTYFALMDSIVNSLATALGAGK